MLKPHNLQTLKGPRLVYCFIRGLDIDTKRGRRALAKTRIAATTSDLNFLRPGDRWASYEIALLIKNPMPSAQRI